MTNLIGRKLGKYELIERLGRGGAAEVYKAFQPGIERFVAHKVLHSHLVESADFVARFHREARAIGRLQHPNIVRVIDFDVEEPAEALAGEQSAGGDEKIYYMIMDYLPGGTLSEWLKAKHTCGEAVSVAETLCIGAKLADALAHAHALGLIHRDIKPGNIMFMDAEHLQPVLTDFGLAHLCDAINPALTMSGALIGTPTYMSPEAVRGEACDARSDLYSLGVVLYEMITGKPPYVADTPYRMMMKQATEPLPLPSTLKPDLPAAVEQLLLKILAKEPADRYQSASELALAIQEVQALLGQQGQPLLPPAVVAGVVPVAVTPVAVTPVAAAPAAATQAQVRAGQSFLRRLRRHPTPPASAVAATLVSTKANPQPVSKKAGLSALLLAAGCVMLVAGLTSVLLITL